MSVALVGIVLSVFSFAISVLTAWLTLFRHGRLAMTKPAVVFFGFDNVPRLTAKVFLRTLLYSTAARGQVVEGMFAMLRRDDAEQIFNFWGYGEANQIVPGSGLFVGQTGVSVNHHFVLSLNQPAYEFLPGDYGVEVFARLVGKTTPIRLADVSLSVTAEQAAILSRRGGVLFELESNDRGYIGRGSDETEAPAVYAGASQ